MTYFGPHSLIQSGKTLKIRNYTKRYISSIWSHGIMWGRKIRICPHAYFWWQWLPWSLAEVCGLWVLPVE